MPIFRKESLDYFSTFQQSFSHVTLPPQVRWSNRPGPLPWMDIPPRCEVRILLYICQEPRPALPLLTATTVHSTDVARVPGKAPSWAPQGMQGPQVPPFKKHKQPIKLWDKIECVVSREHWWVLFPNFLLQRIKQMPTGLRRDQIPVEVLDSPSRG